MDRDRISTRVSIFEIYLELTDKNKADDKARMADLELTNGTSAGTELIEDEPTTMKKEKG
jgi:hypothetical protein